VLGIAAASGRVGYIFLLKGRPHGWGLSRKAAESADEAARLAKEWIDRFRPEVVVTEEIAERSKKGEKTRAIIAAVASLAADCEVYDISVPRPRRYKNKYAEIEALTDRFPELRERLPRQPKLWESEPRNTTVFEALALALEVLDRESLPEPSGE
jgi:glycerol-3-phosphate O-acyltransferase